MKKKSRVNLDMNVMIQNLKKAKKQSVEPQSSHQDETSQETQENEASAVLEPGKEKPTWQQDVTMYIHDLVYMLCTVLVIFMLVFRIIVVSGPSMKQTLLDGDYLLLLSSVFYRDPSAGDVVVISKPTYDDGKPLVKRVIATQGQIVDINFEDGTVSVDGSILEEDYTNTPTNLQEGMVFPMMVEDGCVFVLGDNRNNSKDSRSVEIGLVDRREILGKVMLLMFPGSDYGTQNRDLKRIGVVK